MSSFIRLTGIRTAFWLLIALDSACTTYRVAAADGGGGDVGAGVGGGSGIGATVAARAALTVVQELLGGPELGGLPLPAGMQEALGQVVVAPVVSGPVVPALAARTELAAH